MVEFQSDGYDLDPMALDAFLGEEVERLTQVEGIGTVIDQASRGASTPWKAPLGHYMSLLREAINSPDVRGDNIADALIQSLEGEEGLDVYPDAELAFDRLAAYHRQRRYIRYRPQLRGILRASVTAHEAAHHYAGHAPQGSPDDGQEAIAEIAAFIALRFFGVDTSRISFREIRRFIAGTGQTDGPSLWQQTPNGLPGMVEAADAAKKVILAVARGRKPTSTRRGRLWGRMKFW